LDGIIIIWWKFAQMDEKSSYQMKMVKLDENLATRKWVFEKKSPKLAWYSPLVLQFYFELLLQSEPSSELGLDIQFSTSHHEYIVSSHYCESHSIEIQQTTWKN
jgi:hypothetical protein